MVGRTFPVIALVAAGAVTSVGAVSGDSASHIIGPPPGHTGGFGEPTCVICHEGNALNAFGGSVVLQGLPAAYTPGEVYVLTVVLTAEETAVAGFQLAARFSEGAERGQPAGTLSSLDPRVATTEGEAGQSYAHHTAAGTEVADSDGSNWAVEWRSPAQGGLVVFHVAANSGNGDNSPLDDLVFVAESSVPSSGGSEGGPAG